MADPGSHAVTLHQTTEENKPTTTGCPGCRLSYSPLLTVNASFELTSRGPLASSAPATAEAVAGDSLFVTLSGVDGDLARSQVTVVFAAVGPDGQPVSGGAAPVRWHYEDTGTDADCDRGFSCQAGLCIDDGIECLDARDCPDGEVCDEDYESGGRRKSRPVW